MPLASWAPEMGQFLSCCISLIGDAQALGCGHKMWRADRRVRTDALDDFELLHEVLEDAPFDEWRAFFVAGCSWSMCAESPSVLVHRDLASEHVLYDTGRHEMTGIIDWSEIAVSDRSVDLAGLFHWGGQPYIDAVLREYDGPLDEAVLARARFLAACRGVGDIAFGLTTRRREYIEAGTRALSVCLGGPVSWARDLI